MEFGRKNEVEWLFNHLNKPGSEPSVKVVAGLRRVGKTYLLQTLFQDYLIKEKHFDKKSILPIDLSKIPDNSIRTAEKLEQSITERIKRNPSLSVVFVDEVQLAGIGFAETMKTLAKSYPAVTFYVSGSTSELTSSEILAKFGSEVPSLIVRPLSFREINETMKIDLLDFEKYGGIPWVLIHKDAGEKEECLSSLLEDVFINDILDKVKQRGFEETDTKCMIKYLLTNAANFTKPETIAKGIFSATWGRMTKEEKTIKIANVSAVIDEIKKTYLLESIEQKGLMGRDLLSNKNKLYCVDLGLLTAATSFHPSLTKVYENAVYLDLRSRGYRVLVEHPLVVDSGQNSEKPKEKEIDFVADKGNQHLSIQVVFNFSSIKRFHDEIDHLVDYAKASKCYCVTEDDHHPSQPEIEFLTLREFLMKNSL